MTKPSILSARQDARPRAKARRARRIERREIRLDLVASGYWRRQIATALERSASPSVGAKSIALAERPLRSTAIMASAGICA